MNTIIGVVLLIPAIAIVGCLVMIFALSTYEFIKGNASPDEELCAMFTIGLLIAISTITALELLT